MIADATAVPTGFKLTEVGVIPVDWDVRCLSTTLLSGPKNGYSGRSGKDARGTPTLMLSATTSGRMILNDQTVKRLDETLDSGSDVFLEPGDVLVQRSNTVDLVGMTAVFDGPADFYAYPDLMMRLRFKVPETANWFWRYANSAHGRRYFVSVAAGSTGSMPKLSGDTLRNMPMPMPTLAEQEAIAEALGDADALIDSLSRLVAKKRHLKQAAMQQLLTGKKRLPGFEGEWESKRLPDICWFQEGPGVRNTQFTTSGVKLLNGTNIFRGALDLDTTTRFISREEAHGPYAHFLADAGDIVIASSGITIDRFHEKVAYVRDSDLPFCMNTSTIRFKPKSDSLSDDYLFQFLCSGNFKEAIGGQATGSAQLNFGPSHLAKVELPMPPLAEQIAIAEVLTDMDEELSNYPNTGIVKKW